MHSPTSKLLAVACLTMFAGSGNLASAALISATAVPLSSTGAEIPTDLPRLLAAWDVNDNDAGTPIVNGIPFSGTQPSFITISGFPATVVDWGNNVAHYDSTMADIMGDMVGTNVNVGGNVLLNGLVIGQLYQVTFLHHQDINQSDGRDMEVHFGTSIGDPGTGAFSVGNDMGYISIFEFTADSASQNFFLRPGGNDRAILNAVIVQTVPEPTAILLLVLGALGVVCVTRQCRRA